MSSESDSPLGQASESAADIASRRRQALITVFDERFAESYLGPIAYLDNQVLESPAAISFYKRQFGFVSKVLQYEYQYRSWNGYNQELLDRYAEIINKKLGSISKLLENWKNRFAKILQSNGVAMESTIYNNPLTTTVPLISGHARLYFMVLKDLDAVNLMAGAANLMGVIDSTQRAEGEFMCKKAVRAFEALLRSEVVNLYREAKRLTDAQHGIGKPDSEKAQVLDAQGAELAKFGDQMKADGTSDRSLNLDNIDPSKLIDDAAAATGAAVKAAGRKRASPAETPAADAATVDSVGVTTA